MSETPGNSRVDSFAVDPPLLDYHRSVAGSDAAVGLVLTDLEQDPVAGPELAMPSIDEDGGAVRKQAATYHQAHQNHRENPTHLQRIGGSGRRL
jgi:hypothetical protein